MGYTHYWTLTAKSRKKWKERRQDIYDAIQQTIYDYKSILDDVQLRSLSVRFNGIEDEAHETFEASAQGRDWDFCKTARKPYDTPVCMCLLILQGYADLEVSSDGFSMHSAEVTSSPDGSLEISDQHQWYEAVEALKSRGYDIKFEVEARDGSPYFDITSITVHPPEEVRYEF